MARHDIAFLCFTRFWSQAAIKVRRLHFPRLLLQLVTPLGFNFLHGGESKRISCRDNACILTSRLASFRPHCMTFWSKIKSQVDGRPVIWRECHRALWWRRFLKSLFLVCYRIWCFQSRFTIWSAARKETLLKLIRTWIVKIWRSIGSWFSIVVCSFFCCNFWKHFLKVFQLYKFQFLQQEQN